MMFREAPATEQGPWERAAAVRRGRRAGPGRGAGAAVYADRHGSRIGHGKGHYDRALSHLQASGRVFTIGLAWEIQISDTPLTPDPWDIPLDAIATPREWIATR